MRTLAKRIGANYFWGLFNFALGVAAGSFLGGFVVSVHPGVVYFVNHHSITHYFAESTASTHFRG